MMMTVPQILVALTTAFPREKVSLETKVQYAEHLSDLPPEALEAAARDYIRTARFFPTIADLRERTCERVLGLPSEEIALAQIEARQAWARESEYARGEAPDMHLLVRQALGHVGGAHAFRMTTEPGILRSQFLKLYRDLRAERVRSMQLDARAIEPPTKGDTT